MNTTKWFTVLLLPALAACNSFSNRGLVEKPQVIGTNTTSIEVEKVALSDTSTVLYIKAYYYPKMWIRIASSSFLLDNEGTSYPIRGGDGIEIDKEFWMPDSGEAQFSLLFPPISATATSVDFSEGDDIQGAFKIWGIQLTGQPIPAPKLPKNYTAPTANTEAPLPAVTPKAGIAQFDGQILNYVPDMGKEAELRIFYPFGTKSEKIAIDETGKFSAQLDAFSPHPMSVVALSTNYICFIAPGETTMLLINPTETARRQSHVYNDAPKVSEEFYCGGYLASLSQEINEKKLLYQLTRRSYTTQQEYDDFMLAFADKDVEQAKGVLQKLYNDKNVAIDAGDYSAACKELLHISNDLSFASDLSSLPSYMIYAYRTKYKIGNDKIAPSKYTVNLEFPVGFYDTLKQLKYLNSPERCYSLMTGSYSFHNEEMALYLGTDKGSLFDGMATAIAYKSIVEYDLLDDARLAAVPEIYRAYLQKENDKQREVIASIKAKSGREIQEISPDMPAKDILSQIIARHKGKPIMIDIWGTWCGPCLAANKALKPVKEELKDKGIVYVYIAGENSPKASWEVMSAELPGEHYHITDAQWNGILEAHQSEGVPTYFYVDKKGTIVKKQVGYGLVEPMKEQLLRIAE
ncbi:MAG: TlpA family protein disulfide reductase [Mediterranea sp.]|jgi:thiol-disulfide isomerase/thioredoxin|nr:TlpA family protein disulfide reductase [Mediterranea sp.]